MIKEIVIFTLINFLMFIFFLYIEKILKFIIKNTYRTIHNNIDVFLTSVNNLKNWFKIIWKDREWDHGYFYEIIYFKLERMLKFYENKSLVTVCEERRLRTVKQLKLTMFVLKRIIDDDYYLFEEYDRLSKINQKWALKYIKEMQEQDMDMFNKCIKKYSPCWWD